jgi:chemotaxis protein methyltransferase CheR
MLEGSDRPSGLAVPEGEFVLTWDDFREIAALVHGEAGIVLSENKADLVYSRLARRLRAIGLTHFRDYCALVRDERNVDERQAMIAAMTTNVTRFFREPHHFEHFKSEVLPGLVAAARRGARLRLWSAGCSSGEEPYSLALTLIAHMPDAPEHDILILASDIDSEMIARAKTGTYAKARLADIPPAYHGFVARSVGEAGSFGFAERVRALIRFRQLNLLKAWPLSGAFDVIFCRNVMIYFDQKTQDAIWRRFADKLVPGGHLYIGHSERIAATALPFDVVAQTTYRRGGGM